MRNVIEGEIEMEGQIEGQGLIVINTQDGPTVNTQDGPTVNTQQNDADNQKNTSTNKDTNCCLYVSKILLLFIITLQIVVCMMNMSLVKLELSNNNKKDKECSKWHAAKFCSYSNWTIITDGYISQVQTTIPILHGVSKCKTLSCMILSTDKCYYHGGIPQNGTVLFHKNKNCDGHNTKYRALAGFSIMYMVVSILVEVAFVCFYWPCCPLPESKNEQENVGLIISGIILSNLIFIPATFIVYYQHDNLSLT